MSKFSSVAKGRRARRPVPFPLSGARWSAAKAGWEGETVTVDVRPLTVAENLECVTAAATRARAAGIADPGDGDEVYDVALQIERLLRAVLDHDSPPDAPAPFFESYDEVVSAETLQREHIAYLAEQVELFQQDCSPRELTLTASQMEPAIVRAAEGDARDFLGWSPAMRWSFMRFTAALALTSLRASSPSGSGSATRPPSPPPAAPAPST